MARPTLQTGDVWGEVLANSSIRPIIDGLDNPGSIALVRDENMDSDPTQLKGRTYAFLDRVKVSIGTGRSVSYTGAPVLLGNGTLATVAPSTLALPASTTVAIFINSSGAVAQSNVMPIECIPLAVATTDSDAVTSLLDIRDKAVEQVRPRYLPVSEPFKPGDIKPTFSQNLEAGWLRCEGQLLSAVDYANLFNSIGYQFGGAGSQFRLPDLRGRSLVGAGQGAGLSNRPLGSIGGTETHALSVGEMPSHGHGITDTGHTHSVYDPGHLHGINDPGHRHQLGYKRATINPPTGAPGAELSNADDVQIAQNNPFPFSQTVATNISIRPNPTNISIYGSGAGVSINANGGNAAHNNMQPYCAAHWLIKV